MTLASALADHFDLAERDTDVRTELLAGATTFLTMSYIVVVNPAILTATADSPGIAVAGYSPAEVRGMLAVVTILAAAVATLVMALYADRPFALAPGLGLNAFVAFFVVGTLGVAWQTALAAVVVEGLLFVALTLVGAREYVIRLFPRPVKVAVGTGIGLFLALIGLEAMGVVVADQSTLVTLGPVASDPVAALATVGLLVTLVLYARGLPGAILLGVVATAAAGWVATAAGVVEPGVLAPETLGSPTYDVRPLAGAFLDGFAVEPVTFALVVFTLFFVDFSDTAGTLLGVSKRAGFLDEDGDLPEMDRPLLADAVGTVVGGALGTTTVTTYIESATGVEAGGRTGLTALTVAGLFVAALVLVPLATAIPLYASHIALVMVGVVMVRSVADVDWDDATEAVPAAMTAVFMPLTFSIAYGIAAGVVSYPLVKTAAGDHDDVAVGQWALAGAFVVYFVVRTGGILEGMV
jgi:AGZA family xanthine/uracil permease-like MFS transporter